MPIFRIPQGQTKSGGVAVKDLFQQTVTQNKERSSVYRRWSEKATIVSYNENLETYDIVITSVSYTNNETQVSKVNRTMRNVRAIIPASVYIFKPGEVVLIGYVSERRESPVILGLKAAKASQTTTIVTDGDGLTDGIVPACTLSVISEITGEEVGGVSEFVVECINTFGVAGTFQIPLKAICNVGPVIWSWDVTDCVYTNGRKAFDLIAVGVNNQDATLTKNTGPSTNDLDHPCTAFTACARYKNGVGLGCSFDTEAHYYNYAGQTITIKSRQCASFFGGTCEDCDAITCPICTDGLEETIGPNCPSCYAELVGCDDIANIPTVTQNWLTTMYGEGYGFWQPTGGEMDYELTAEEQTANIDGTHGCCNCSDADRSIVTVTDDIGQSFSITIRTASPEMPYN